MFFECDYTCASAMLKRVMRAMAAAAAVAKSLDLILIAVPCSI
jgi:hypothetical protein